MVVFKTTDGGFTYSNGFKIQQSYVVSHRFDVADGPLMLLAIFVDPSSFFLNKCLGPTWCFCYSFGLFQLASCLGSVVLFVLFSLVLKYWVFAFRSLRFFRFDGHRTFFPRVWNLINFHFPRRPLFVFLTRTSRKVVFIQTPMPRWFHRAHNKQRKFNTVTQTNLGKLE